jgi:7-keto-8-aminopelargonate synthetase-like enzyme
MEAVAMEHDAPALPLDRLARSLQQHGIGRFYAQMTERYGAIHLKDLAVTALGPGRWMEVNGRRVANFGSDSFLGLDQDPRVQAAIRRGLDRWGTHNGASRLFASVETNVEVERRLARWLGTEATLTFPSVTLANHGVIPGLAGKADVVVLDEQAHNSMQEGARIARAGGARVATFAHCDPADLARTLKRLRPYRFALVAVDGVYSMSGQLPPLADLRAVATDHDGILYVDDAHGTGVLGAHGRGTVLDALGDYDNTLVIGSLSKAFSCLGAFVGCPAALVPLLKGRSNTYVFGGPVPPPYLEGLLAVLDVLESAEYAALKARLDARLAQLVAGLRGRDLMVLGGLTPIVSILVGDEGDTLRAGHYLFERGYYVQSVTFPAVPYHAGVLRIQVNANHEPAMVAGLLDALDGLRRRVPLPRATEFLVCAAA